MRDRKSRTRALGERFSDKYEKRRTEWWMIQSAANQSPYRNSLINKEDTGIFSIF
jgi:hypothetical protein